MAERASGRASANLHPFVFRESGGDHNVRVVHHTGGGNIDGDRHLQNHIRLADGPTLGELPRRGRVLLVAFLCAAIDPRDQRVDLMLRERTVVRELAEVRIREPWRHLLGEHRGLDRLGPGTDLVVAHEAHRRHFARPMAFLAAVLQHRRDVFVICRHARNRAGCRGDGSR